MYLFPTSRGTGRCHDNGRLSGALHMIWPHVMRSVWRGWNFRTGLREQAGEKAGECGSQLSSEKMMWHGGGW